ncbi:MAG TPA: ABC transporter permease [Vicinamibacterales bacterium]|nr:ABC transporter permease [Vicinamibacterales bacterium]
MAAIDNLLMRLARLSVPRGDREWMAGDLEEEWRRVRAAEGRVAAIRWLLAETGRNVRHTLSLERPQSKGRLFTRNLGQDFRYALRLFRRAPAFTATVLVTLALGIGANTAIFSVVDALLFKPLPYPHAERLYAVTLANDTLLGMQYWPYPKYAAFARTQDAFDLTAAYARTELVVDTGREPLRVRAEVVSSSYFPLFGLTPAIGRAFTAQEEAVPARDAVIILGDALWRSAFAADRGVIGRTLAIKGRPYEIVGVMPPAFQGQTGTAQIWLPVMMADHFMYEGAASQAFGWWMRVAARVRPDMTLHAAQSRMPAITERTGRIDASRLARATKNGREQFQLLPLRDVKVDPVVGRSFLILLAAVGFVLLIATANTANLLVGRAVTRRAEFALRRAIGASQATVIRQVLVESLVLAVASGAAALVVSVVTQQWLMLAKPMTMTGFWSQYAQTFDYFTVGLEPRMLAFNFAVALGAGLLFGLLPARQAARADLITPLKGHSGASAAGFRRFGVRGALVFAEVAFSIVLLVSAGLMTRSFARAASANLGFTPDGVITMTASTPSGKPASFYRELLQRVEAIPGVQMASLADVQPLSGGGSRGPVSLDQASQPSMPADMNVVTRRYFETFRIRTLEGRLFTDDDRETAPRVAVVNRTFAQAAWPGLSPVGRRVRTDFRVAYGDPKAWTTIVGVVDDAIYGTLEDPPSAMIYLPAWQPLGRPQAISLAPSTIAVRTSLPTSEIVAAVREQVRQLDGSAPLTDIATMRERAARLTSRYRYGSTMMVALAALALLLAAIGTYAVIAFAVATRTREIGIRVALGARPADVFALVVGGGLSPTLAGVAAGLVAAFASARVLDSMLYGVTPHDPATFGGIALLMAAVALLASYLPARRAMRVDPVVALRQD